MGSVIGDEALGKSLPFASTRGDLGRGGGGKDREVWDGIPDSAAVAGREAAKDAGSEVLHGLFGVWDCGLCISATGMAVTS